MRGLGAWRAEPVALGAFLNATLGLLSLLWWHLDETKMAAALLVINTGIGLLVRGSVVSPATIHEAGHTVEGIEKAAEENRKIDKP